jgi:predicted nucleotidyltransferase
VVIDLRDNIEQDCKMDKNQVIAKLREHEPELKAAGVEHLFLHGSYARGTAIREVSDVDVIAEFDRAKRLSLIGRAHLENRLTDILGVKADLADRSLLRPEVLEQANRESVLVF